MQATVTLFATFNASGSVTISYSLESIAGFELVNLRPRFTHSATPSSSVSLSASARAGGRVQVMLRLAGVPLADVNAHLGLGAFGSLTPRTTPPPGYCLDVGAYIYLRFSALSSGLVGRFAPTIATDLWNRTNSPWRWSWHIEDGSVVQNCTHGVATGIPFNQNLSFEQGLLGWESEGDVRAIHNLGPLGTTHTNQMAILGTGLGAVADSDSAIRRTFTNVPVSYRYLRLDYNFVSEEVESFWGSIFDDTMTISIISGGQSREVFRSSVNSVPRNQWHNTFHDLFPGGDSVAHHTGWQELSIYIGNLTSFTLEVRVWDMGDSAFDSSVLLDNLRFTVTPGVMPLSAQAFGGFMFIPVYDLSQLEMLIGYALTLDTGLLDSDSIEILADFIVRAKMVIMNANCQLEVERMLVALQSIIYRLFGLSEFEQEPVAIYPDEYEYEYEYPDYYEYELIYLPEQEEPALIYYYVADTEE
jgi:hypothetical protein